jgi:hypothetical protein
MTEMTETAQDAVLEAVEAPGTRREQPRWHRHVALTTLIMALLAALGGMLAGMTANKALLNRTTEIIRMSSLEGDRQFVETLRSKHEILAAMGRTPDPAEVQRIVAFEQGVAQLEAETAREEALALSVADAHMVFAVAVTLLSLGITLGGMAVVVERKWLWVVGLLVGAAGAAGLGMGILTMMS